MNTPETLMRRLLELQAEENNDFHVTRGAILRINARWLVGFAI